MGRKQKREELDAVAVAARQVLATDNVDEMERVLISLTVAWREAGEEDGDTASEVIGELTRRIEALKRRPLEQALRSCRICQCGTFWISTERSLDRLGRVRVAVCDGCGAMTMFSAVRIRDGMGFQKVVAPEGSGPFR